MLAQPRLAQAQAQQLALWLAQRPVRLQALPNPQLVLQSALLQALPTLQLVLQLALLQALPNLQLVLQSALPSQLVLLAAQQSLMPLAPSRALSIHFGSVCSWPNHSRYTLAAQQVPQTKGRKKKHDETNCAEA